MVRDRPESENGQESEFKVAAAEEKPVPQLELEVSVPLEFAPYHVEPSSENCAYIVSSVVYPVIF
jgi:hypothetical protein